MRDKDIIDLQAQWERLARSDPLWAILSDPTKKGGGWSVEAFFETGVAEADEVMEYADWLCPALRHQDALDFGCGVGRVTQALAGHFEHTVGIDISPTMIELAKHYDHSEGRCAYILNGGDNLAQFKDNSFDFIYSNITLQHMRTRLAAVYLREFVRLLRPDGLLLFQLPTDRPPGLRGWLSSVLPIDLRRRRWGGMDMYVTPREVVVLILETVGARLLDAQEDASARRWPSLRYAVSK